MFTIADALHVLLPLADKAGPHQGLLTVADLERWPPEVVRRLEDSGLLATAPATEEIPCPSCQRNDRLAVETLAGPQGDFVFVACPHCGIQAVDEMLTQCWQVTPGHLARFLASALALAQTPEKMAETALWRLGTAVIAGCPYTLYLASFADPTVIVRLKERSTVTASEPPSLVFYPAVPPPAEPVLAVRYLSLGSVLRWDTQSLVVDSEVLKMLVDPDALNRQAADYLFRRNPTGTWEFRFEGQGCPALEDQLGFRYLQYLLQTAHQALPANALSAVGHRASMAVREASDQLIEDCAEADLSIGDLGDAGVLLDRTAQQQYKARLAKLREEKEEAEFLNDPERLAGIEEEIAMLVKQLRQATGLKGRPVKAASSQKRARQAVTSAINRAISELTMYHPPLGEHLRKSISTGNSCVYRPAHKIRWHC